MDSGAMSTVIRPEDNEYVIDTKVPSRKIFVMAFGAGSVFGSLFVILGHTSDNSGLWPVLAMRVTSVPFMFMRRVVSEWG